MKFKGLVLASALLTSTLFAQNISATNNWQLLGATEIIDATVFNGKCVDFVWKYNNGWKLHIANNHDYGYTGDTFSSLNKGEGFWIKGNSSCSFDTNNTNDSNATDLKFTKDMLAGKTLYTYVLNSSNNGSTPETCILEMIFTSSKITQNEWVYHSDNNWTAGCNEDFGNIKNSNFSITNGILTWESISGWWFKLDAIYNDRYVVTDPDGTSNWYFSKEKINNLLSQ